MSITPDLQEVLDRRRKSPDGNDLAADAHAFGDETGKMIEKRWFNRRWRELCDSLKIQDLNFHDLRHESASQLLEAGAASRDGSNTPPTAITPIRSPPTYSTGTSPRRRRINAG